MVVLREFHEKRELFQQYNDGSTRSSFWLRSGRQVQGYFGRDQVVNFGFNGSEIRSSWQRGLVGVLVQCPALADADPRIRAL